MTEIMAPLSVLDSQSDPLIFFEAPPVPTYGSFQTIGDRLALPEKLSGLPEWLRAPLGRYLRLKQRNWPAKTVQRSTRQLFNRLSKMIDFLHPELWLEQLGPGLHTLVGRLYRCQAAGKFSAHHD